MFAKEQNLKVSPQTAYQLPQGKQLYSDDIEQYFDQVIKININIDFLTCDTLTRTNHFCSILAAIHNLNLIITKHQTNPNWKAC